MAASLKRRNTREPPYGCRCQDTGMIAVPPGRPYTTIGGIEVPAELSRGAMRRCHVCNQEPAPKARQRRDYA